MSQNNNPYYEGVYTDIHRHHGDHHWDYHLRISYPRATPLGDPPDR